MVSSERKAELEFALKKDAPWGAEVRFLDSINSIEELEELTPMFVSGYNSGSIAEWLISIYRDNLIRWPDPKLEDQFKKDFPLVSARLDTPQKVRIFLRGADFRKVDEWTMASVFEEIIRQHDIEGREVVRFGRYRGDSFCDALRIVYHTQLQAWTLTRLMLPGSTSHGFDQDGLYIDWRTRSDIDWN